MLLRLWTGAAVALEGIISLRRTLQIGIYPCLCYPLVLSFFEFTQCFLVSLFSFLFVVTYCPLHTTARPVDRHVVVGVACRPLCPLVLGQVAGVVLDAQGHAGGCEGEEGEAGVAGTESAGFVSCILSSSPS